MSEDSDQPTDQQLEPLPAEKLCNRLKDPNPIYGDGALGNEKTEQMYYGGNDKTKLVITLQKMLKTLDYDLGTSGPDKDGADGKFEDKTEDAVRDFQGKNRDWDGRPLKVDGLVGPDTSDALNRAMVGKWYDHYQTPEKLVEGKPYHTATTVHMNSGLLIRPGNAKEGKVFLVGQIPWKAMWERQDEPVSIGSKRKMILIAPGLLAGQKVIFKVIQEVEDKKSIVAPQIVADAQDGRAEVEFGDWFKEENVIHKMELKEGQNFPQVKFSFVADTIEKNRSTSAPPLLYKDVLHLRFMYKEPPDTPIKNTEYALNSPWGTIEGRTDNDGYVLLENLPPGGARVVLRNFTIDTGHIEVSNDAESRN